MIKPRELHEAMAHLRCISEKQFIELWGEHLYYKFATVYEGDVGRWICSLDLCMLRQVCDYLNQHFICLQSSRRNRG